VRHYWRSKCVLSVGHSKRATTPMLPRRGTRRWLITARTRRTSEERCDHPCSNAADFMTLGTLVSNGTLMPMCLPPHEELAMLVLKLHPRLDPLPLRPLSPRAMEQFRQLSPNCWSRQRSLGARAMTQPSRPSLWQMSRSLKVLRQSLPLVVLPLHPHQHQKR
jgi:hypothetical protein